MNLLDLGRIVVGIALLTPVCAGLWRLSKGPTALDRLIGFDMLVVTVVALVLLFSRATQSVDFIEFVMVVSCLSFLTTVAYFYYLMQLRPNDEEFKDSP